MAGTTLKGPGRIPLKSLSGTGVPMGSSFRVPVGGGAALKGRSVFDVNVRGPSAQMRQVPIRGMNPPRPAPSLGQEEAPIPFQEVERIIQRELPSAGFSTREATDTAAVLSQSIEVAQKAIAEGEICIGIDSASLEEARQIRDFLVGFASQARPAERTDALVQEDMTLIERVIECAVAYEKIKAAEKGRTVALVIGGILASAVVIAILS